MHIAILCGSIRRYARFPCHAFNFYVHDNPGCALSLAVAAAVASVVVASAEKHKDNQQKHHIVATTSAKTHMANLLSDNLHSHLMIPAGIGA